MRVRQRRNKTQSLPEVEKNDALSGCLPRYQLRLLAWWKIVTLVTRNKHCERTGKIKRAMKIYSYSGGNKPTNVNEYLLYFSSIVTFNGGEVNTCTYM